MSVTYSIVPNKFEDKDPRNLLYHFPSLPIVKFAKMYQEFSHYKQLKVAESMAKSFGCVLVPLECMNWKRRQKFGVDKKIKVGRNSYFIMQLNELTTLEKKKLKEYLEGLND